MKKTLAEKILGFFSDLLVEYLMLNPEEQQEKRKQLESKKEIIREAIGRVAVRILVCTGIAFIIGTFALVVSEPMKAFLMESLKGVKPLFEALWDFSPKLSVPLVLFLSAYASTVLFMHLYGIEKGSEAAKRITSRLAIVCVINCGITLLSAFVYAFSTGSLDPIITLAFQIGLPNRNRILLALGAAYLAAIIVSVVEIAKILYEGYRLTNKLLLKLYINFIYR